jgi:SAM-dependent methyltransferase
MRQEFESTYHALEESHWWFTSRRALIRSLVRRLAGSTQASILEVGCSGGPLLQQLRADGYPHLTGIDISAQAIAVCGQRQVPNVSVMDAQHLQFEAESFDVIIASDVLEHLPDAPAALLEWRRALKPGGQLFVFVPAFMFLWSEHDVSNLHHHRYRSPELNLALQTCGFTVERSGYWNFLLFMPAAAVRLLKKLLFKTVNAAAHDDLKPTAAFVNRLLQGVMRVENRLFLAGVNFPWGISAWAIARKP